MLTSPNPAGRMLREWRQRRRLSQFALALEAEISPRHLSFLETGRSQASRAMLLRLAEFLEVPLRERNLLLQAAGYAAVYSEHGLEDDVLRAARDATARLLDAQMPYPALAVDRHWNALAMNGAVLPLLAGAAGHLLQPPVNVLRLSLHPEGLAPRILNLHQWRAHLLARLRGQIAATGDPSLSGLLAQLESYPAPTGSATDPDGGWVIPLRLATDAGALSLLSTTTIFGTPQNVTLSEIAIESFFPADAETARRLHAACPPS